MNDPIERQDAIEVVKRQRKISWDKWHETRPSAERIIEDLKELPAAQPERPKGHWIIDGHHIQCSVCAERMCNTDREGDKIPRNFCPNCGSDMRGGERNDEPRSN